METLINKVAKKENVKAEAISIKESVESCDPKRLAVYIDFHNTGVKDYAGKIINGRYYQSK